MAEQVLVVYKGVEYDVKEFLGKHPGGPNIIKSYINFDKNIT